MVKAGPSETARQIKAHVERYRLSTVDAVHRLFFPSKTRDAAKKALNRMVQDEELSSFQIGKRAFYQAERQPQPSSQTIWERFAVLTFCVMREPRRERMTPAEFLEAFPEFATAAGISASHQHYFLTIAEGNDALGRAVVDSDAEPLRVVRKYKELLRHAKSTSGLLELFDEDAFFVALLFAEEGKAKDVQTALRAEPLGRHFQIHVIPELNDIIHVLPLAHGTDP